jgi:hypothetical protein
MPAQAPNASSANPITPVLKLLRVMVIVLPHGVDLRVSIPLDANVMPRAKQGKSGKGSGKERIKRCIPTPLNFS